MEGRLVGDRSGEDGRAVARMGQGHHAEPIGPVAVEAALQAISNCVASRRSSGDRCARPSAPSAVPVSAMSACATAGEATVGARVGTAPPHRWGGRWGSSALAASRDEAEFFAAPDRRPAAVHIELRVDALRVGPDRAQTDDQLLRDSGAIEVGCEKPKDIELSFAEGLHEALLAVSRPRASGRAEESPNILGRDATPRCGPEQGRHRDTFRDERPDIAFRLGQDERPAKRLESRSRGSAVAVSEACRMRISMTLRQRPPVSAATRSRSRSAIACWIERGSMVLAPCARRTLARLMCSYSPT